MEKTLLINLNYKTKLHVQTNQNYFVVKWGKNYILVVLILEKAKMGQIIIFNIQFWNIVYHGPVS